MIPSDGSSLDNYPVVVDAAIDPAGTMLTGTLAIKDGVNTQRITIPDATSALSGARGHARTDRSMPSVGPAVT